MVTDLHKAAQQALEALEATNKAMLANRDALAERGARPATNKAHQYLWDSSFAVYADVAIPAYAALREALAKPAVPEWIAVSERMPEPGVPVLACYTNRLGNTRRIRAFWTPANTMESDGDSDIGVYDEATDTYYDPAGWYECMDNWDEYSAIFVNEGEVTHWMPLPAAPQPKDKP